MQCAEQWQTWDVRRSLFDNNVSPSFEANMEYMYKHFGFYFPDAEYLVDPEGLLKYLVRGADLLRLLQCNFMMCNVCGGLRGFPLSRCQKAGAA